MNTSYNSTDVVEWSKRKLYICVYTLLYTTCRSQWCNDNMLKLICVVQHRRQSIYNIVVSTEMVRVERSRTEGQGPKSKARGTERDGSWSSWGWNHHHHQLWGL